MIRGRFASSNDQWWITKACDGFSEIERLCTGPANLRRAQAYQITSGFVPTPKSIFKIKRAWLNGELITHFRALDSRGFQLDPGVVTVEKHDVTISCPSDTEADISFVNQPSLTDAIPLGTIVNVSFNGVTKVGTMAFVSGNPLPSDPTTMYHWPIWMGGMAFHILSASYTGPNQITFQTDEVGSTLSNSPCLLGGFAANSLAGAEVQVGNDLVAIGASTWSVPGNGPGGYSDPLAFVCERAQPGRVCTDIRAGFILKSNLIIEGYRTFARPTSMTDPLDLDPGDEVLIEMYLRWRAESEMDPASSTAKTCENDFNVQLKQFVEDGEATHGDVTQHRYNMKMRLRRRY